MTKEFLSLEDAVKVAHAQWGIDPELARNEFEQKCYMTDDQYKIGYDDGLIDAIKAIEALDICNNWMPKAEPKTENKYRPFKNTDELIEAWEAESKNCDNCEVACGVEE